MFYAPVNTAAPLAGNPLACAIARTALKVLVEEHMIENAAAMGDYFLSNLSKIRAPHIKEVRGRGLTLAVELMPDAGGARKYC